MNKQVDLKELLESKMKDIKPVEGAEKAIEAAEKNIPHNLMFYAESTEFKPETKPVAAIRRSGMTVEEAKAFNNEIKRFIDTVLVAGVDYGTIPHCSKPSLLKSGAEKILTYLGLVARTEIVNRFEDYNTGFFSYEVKVYVIDEFTGVIKGVGVAAANTKESKYAKGSGFNYQNVVMKMAKKRAFVDAALNVGNLSACFTQDVEDMTINPEPTLNNNGSKPQTKSAADNKTVTPPKPAADNKTSTPTKPATVKQLNFLTSLMNKYKTSANAMNRYVKQNFGVDDYNKISSIQASALIEKYIALEKQ